MGGFYIYDFFRLERQELEQKICNPKSKIASVKKHFSGETKYPNGYCQGINADFILKAS